MSYNLDEVDVKMKLKINKTTSLEDIKRYLFPIKDYVREKKKKICMMTGMNLNI